MYHPEHIRAGDNIMVLGTEANRIGEACHSHPQFPTLPPEEGLRNDAEARGEATEVRVINTPIGQLKKRKHAMKLTDRRRKSSCGQQLPIP